MFHGRRVPQASQDLKWLPPESNTLQDEIESAPTITFAQFRRLAKRREWSVKYLVEQYGEELPTDTIRRVLDGATVDGKHDKLESTVIPYWPLIQLHLS
jgi:hypothetical protein